MRACASGCAQLLFSQAEHDAAIAATSKAHGMAPPRLRRACRGYLPVPWFGHAAVERAYTAYMSNETMRAAVGTAIVMAVGMAFYLNEDVTDPDPTDRGTRILLRAASLAVILGGILAVLVARSRLAPRANLWVRWGAVVATGLLIKTRCYYEPTYPMYIRAIATWSIALKALYVAFETGFQRVATFIVLDTVADLYLENVRSPSPEGVPYQWELMLLVWFMCVAYAFDVQSRVSFALKVTLYLSRVTAEEANRLHRFLIDNTLDMICVHQLPRATAGDDPAGLQPGRILYVSESVTRLTGWTRDDLIGHNPLAFIHEGDREVGRALFTSTPLVSDGCGATPAAGSDDAPVGGGHRLLRLQTVVAADVDMDRDDGGGEVRGAAAVATVTSGSSGARGPGSAAGRSSGSAELTTALLPPGGDMPGFEYFGGWRRDLATAVQSRVAADAALGAKGVVVPDPFPLPALHTPRPVAGEAGGGEPASPVVEGALPIRYRAASVPSSPATLVAPRVEVAGDASMDGIDLTVRAMRRYSRPPSPAPVPHGAEPPSHPAGSVVVVSVSLPGTAPATADAADRSGSGHRSRAGSGDGAVDGRVSVRGGPWGAPASAAAGIPPVTAPPPAAAVSGTSTPGAERGRQPLPLLSEVRLLPPPPTATRASASAASSRRGSPTASSGTAPAPVSASHAGTLQRATSSGQNSGGANSHYRLRFRARRGDFIMFEVTTNVTLHGLVCVYRPV